MTDAAGLGVREILLILQQRGHLSEEQFALATRKALKQNNELHPIEKVARLKLTSAFDNKTLTEERITAVLAEHFKLDYFRIDPLKVDVKAVTQVMSLAFAQRHRILAVASSEDDVVIAVTEPKLTSWQAGLAQILRKEIRTVLANPTAIRRYQKEFYSLSDSVRGATGDATESSELSNLEQLIELGDSGEVDANDQHVVKIVDWLLQYAFEQRASDIHIEPRRETGVIRFRIDGVLHQVYELPAQITSAVVSRLKILGRMDVAEKRKPLDGRIKTKSPSGKEIELRLSTIPTAFGEKFVSRIFDPGVLDKQFSQLGLEQDTETTWREMINQSTGIVLVTGPTGSGKTTTLYTSLKHIATPEVNVCTIEDPIEMVEPRLNQMQVHHDIDLDFASGVRSLLRQDPDIIMIGEIRDRETAEMAIQASLTGHLVISTLHTNDAPSAITRLVEIGIEPYLIKATLLGIMAQRLVRVLCDHCKAPVKTDSEAWNDITAGIDLATPETVYEPVGCDECRHTGFAGRQGIYELLTVSEPQKENINHEGDLVAIRRQAIADGMNLLRVSGAYKVLSGTTTIAEVIRVAPNTAMPSSAAAD